MLRPARLFAGTDEVDFSTTDEAKCCDQHGGMLGRHERRAMTEATMIFLATVVGVCYDVGRNCCGGDGQALRPARHLPQGRQKVASAGGRARAGGGVGWPASTVGRGRGCGGRGRAWRPCFPLGDFLVREVYARMTEEIDSDLTTGIVHIERLGAGRPKVGSARRRLGVAKEKAQSPRPRLYPTMQNPSLVDRYSSTGSCLLLLGAQI